MPCLEQMPAPGTRVLHAAGDVLDVTLRVDASRRGEAFLRTNLGQATVRLAEIVRHTEADEPPLASDWHDLPMLPEGPGLYRARVPLTEVGWFACKACFLPAHSASPEWPPGADLQIKVMPSHTACANTVYTAFVRQFGPPSGGDLRRHEEPLDHSHYTVIPPSGTFRELARRLDTILGEMRFRILQLLPIHPIPTTFARMGRFGSPFAGLDFLSVDPALAEFDRSATPMDQFRELVDAVHARGARLFLDIPANHTGWASTLQIHHPEWFRRHNGVFMSPGAWGVTWEDLVELDYRHPELRAHMADVFLFWLRNGVDGFRCDAGYMIPVEAWVYIVARVRLEFPDTIFLLEGLGGAVEVTQRLLTEANLDWAYSELFQTEDRVAMEHYLPSALALSAAAGPLIHYAETHDNLRLAARSETYARMRTALAALLSQQGAFGIANGVEWFATERVDVHGNASLNWGDARNQVRLLARLNALLERHPAFGLGVTLQQVQEGLGNSLAVVRQAPASPGETEGRRLLVLINLDVTRHQPVQWPAAAFDAPVAWDVLSGAELQLTGPRRRDLAPGLALCLTSDPNDLTLIDEPAHPRTPPGALRRRRALLALRIRRWLGGGPTLAADERADDLEAALCADPVRFCTPPGGRMPAVVEWRWPEDQRRTVMVPPHFLLMVRAPHPFRLRLNQGGRTVAAEESLDWRDEHLAIVPVPLAERRHERLTLDLRMFTPPGTHICASAILALAPGREVRAPVRFSGTAVRRNRGLLATLGNGRGAAAHVRAAWGEIHSQYDCLLAVNQDARVPVDRRVFFTRCRAWLRRRGFSHAIDAACLAGFEADPAGWTAAWTFKVPTGIGGWVNVRFTLRLTPGRNQARLWIAREADHGLADREPVTVVLRPDIEWRTFHGKTKAYTGPEKQWPGAVAAEPAGFVFRPERGETCSIRMEGGVFHSEPHWQYMVAHPEDAARGQDGSSDLFSPGWFACELCGGQEAVLLADRADPMPDGDTQPAPPPPDQPSESERPLPDVLKRALGLYLVARDTELTVLAGFPWFLDWGRDALIALRGLAADGRAEDALRILREFGRMERQGTLPNMIRGSDDSNRDTSDAPLWFGVAAADLIRALGADTVLEAPCGGRSLRDVLVSIADHYRGGTPNGIRMDPASALVYSPPHFTWMDTNYPAATPREGYPIDIQALWIAMLDLLGTRVDPAWASLAERARQSVSELYWLPEEGWMADNRRASPVVAACQGVADDALRPNQLLAITLGACADRARRASALRACGELLVPGAIRSLADRPVRLELPVVRDGHPLNDPRRPYRGHYTGDEDTHRKPAYHNGTAWTWLFPLYAEALVEVYGDAARDTALALLGSSSVLLESGSVGHVPEILDGDAPHTPRGCSAQAWGVSEWLRVWRTIERGGTVPSREER